MEPILDSTKKIRHHLSVLGRVGFKLLLKKVPESLLHDLFHLEYDNSIKMKGRGTLVGSMSCLFFNCICRLDLLQCEVFVNCNLVSKCHVGQPLRTKKIS